MSEEVLLRSIILVEKVFQVQGKTLPAVPARFKLLDAYHVSNLIDAYVSLSRVFVEEVVFDAAPKLLRNSSGRVPVLVHDSWGIIVLSINMMSLFSPFPACFAFINHMLDAAPFCFCNRV